MVIKVEKTLLAINITWVCYLRTKGEVLLESKTTKLGRVGKFCVYFHV